MNYYPELLTSAFSTLVGERMPNVLALTASDLESEGGASPTEGRFEYPETLLPTGSTHQRLPGDESFLDKARAAVAASQCNCVFVFPPLMINDKRSSDWRSLIEWVAISLLGDPEVAAFSIFPPPPRDIDALAMLVPSSFVGSIASGRWRNEFFSAHSAVVIEHDHTGASQAFGFPIHAAFRFATVIFQRRPGPIRFFKVSPEAVSENPDRLSSDLKSLLRQPAGKTRFGYVYQGQLDDGYPCSYDYYSEETQKLRQEVGVLGEKVSLSTVADVLTGWVPCLRNHKAEAGFLFISGKDITRDGRSDLSDLQTQTKPSIVQHYLQDGDFCVRQISQGNQGFVVGVYEGDGRTITFHSGVIVVRPFAHINSAQRQVLLSFLRSTMALRLGQAKQMMSSNEGHVLLSPRLLREFPVPLADDELVSTIQQLNEARAAFAEWIKHIDQESNAILIEATATGSRRRLLNAGQLARQRHRAGEQVKELDYRIRTQFPHPLAYVWRELQVAGPDRYLRLRAVTKAAEGHTCFLALVAILMSRAVGQPIKYVGEMAKRLTQRKGGTSFGDWFAILKEVNESRAFRAIRGAISFAEITQLCDTDSWETAVKELMALRNDDGHLRISPAKVSESLLAKSESALAVLYNTSEFLTDYQLMLVTETRFDSIRQMNHYQYRDLTGDNALAPLRHDQAARSDLESNSLYLRDRKKHLHLFRPLLQYLECPECHQMSTFFLDTYDPSARDLVGLKSFERNSVRLEPLGSDFRHVGLLP